MLTPWADNSSFKRSKTVAYLNRSVAQWQLGNLAGALNDADEATRLNPQMATPHFVRATVYYKRRAMPEALPHFCEAIRLNPEFKDAYCTRSLVYQAMGDSERALADCDRAIELASTEPVPWNNRGFIRMKRGEYAEAMADYRRAIDCGPHHPNAHKNLAWLLATCPDARFRNGLEAIRHARRALELDDRKQAEWYESLAAAYAESSDFGAAARWQAEAIELFGGDAPSVSAERLAVYQARQPWRE
ncbi:MAG TPA: tetratricopeptide repeat protein [Pirellulales bacterium]|nr:tetratricopeptide repeat protein [Pirellulales bacterium]